MSETSKTTSKTIGFIGQGWIGKHYADDFETRGYATVRYAKEEPYAGNKDKIAECDIVLIAVPTPTTPQGFDDSILRSVIPLVGSGKTAVIKSTVLPGITESIQKENPGVYVLHSPEFLSEATAAFDAANPKRNIVGIPVDDEEYRRRAQWVLDVLPRAPYEKICLAREAELIKYARNGLGYVRVVFMNMLYDMATSVGADWAVVRDAIANDPDNGPTYTNPVHKSGRGAGGHCFIKDFRAFSEKYKALFPEDAAAIDALEGLQRKNNELLKGTGKDLDLLKGVYGDNV